MARYITRYITFHNLTWGFLPRKLSPFKSMGTLPIVVFTLLLQTVQSGESSQMPLSPFGTRLLAKIWFSSLTVHLASFLAGICSSVPKLEQCTQQVSKVANEEWGVLRLCYTDRWPTLELHCYHTADVHDLPELLPNASWPSRDWYCMMMTVDCWRSLSSSISHFTLPLQVGCNLGCKDITRYITG